MNAVDGATIERRIRICRPDDENARCKVSRVRVQPKDFSQRTQPLTTLSTSSAISPQQECTEPSGPRRCRRGAKSSLRREPKMPADLLRALFGNVTVPYDRQSSLERRVLTRSRSGTPELLQLRRTTHAPPARRIFSQSASAAAREGAGART